MSNHLPFVVLIFMEARQVCSYIICRVAYTECILLAAQMWELVTIFPFLVGQDFPADDPHYACFLLLCDISTVLFSPVIACDQVPFLKLQIQEYLEQFTSLYPHRSLTPKFHYLVHTPSLIKRLETMSNCSYNNYYTLLSDLGPWVISGQ